MPEKSEQFFAFQFTVFKLLQPKNALFPIEVTALPIVTDLKPLLLKASSPIEVTELPMVTDVKVWHSWKA